MSPAPAPAPEPTLDERQASLDQFEASLGQTHTPWMRTLIMSARIDLAMRRGFIVAAQQGAA